MTESVGAGTAPRWSVVIPTWNGRHLLSEAFEALDRQTLTDFEVVVVDDSSDDDTVAWLRAIRPAARLVRLRRRRAFAFALNRGLEAARGEFVALLNNDAVPDPGWLAAFDAAFVARPEISFVASRIVLQADPTRLHAAGDLYGADGLPGNRGVWEHDGPRFAVAREVFGACAAAAGYRRRLFDEIGGFDEDLVMYCEDVDLSWRAQLAGHRCLYVPGARVVHRLRSTGGGALESYLVSRNRPLVALMNLPGFVWRQAWWRILGAQLRLAAEALWNFRGKAARASLAGQFAAIALLARAGHKRARRQRNRRASEAYIWSLLD